MKPIPPEEQIRTWVWMLHKHIETQSEVLALRHIVLELAKASGQNRDEVARLLAQTEKFFHQKYLEGIEDHWPWLAGLMDTREIKDIFHSTPPQSPSPPSPPP